MKQNLYKKVFTHHTVKQLSKNQYQLFIGLHLIHEVTSPQAFATINEKNIPVAFPNLTYATVDHIIPTEKETRKRPLQDTLAEQMLVAIEDNTEKHNIQFFGTNKGQGIVHVVGPENGLTKPGMTIACGDSHTSTHGAFGSLAFGIGTSQITDILATQTMRVEKLKVRKIVINGTIPTGVYAKDVILAIINKLGVKGGVGYAYEYAGKVIENMSIEERMTICNMSIEGGAKIGYINPDQKTYDYLKGRPYAPKNEEWVKSLTYWKSIRSDPDAEYDDIVTLDGNQIKPFITWGITPAQSSPIDEKLPAINNFEQDEQLLIKEAYEYMSFNENENMIDKPIDIVFIGSCTNGRLSDFQEVAKIVKGKKVSPKIQALAVPGSEKVQQEIEALGIHTTLIESGFEWREPGCSMCLAMNPDQLKGRQISASTSNRNFKGRQGSPTGRTLLMSPATAAVTALNGTITDPRPYLTENKKTI